MVFSLEVLQALHGDCLLLYYGKDDSPEIMVIDGGPGGVYAKCLKPRLLKLKQQLSPHEKLPLSLVMVSHMDDDHINGILALTADVREAIDDQEEPFVEIDNMWYNTFDDIIGNIEIPEIAAITTSAIAASVSDISSFLTDNEFSAVIASTGQGRQLHEDAENIGAIVNNPFHKIGPKKSNLVRGDLDTAVIEWGPNLKIQVLHPNTQRLKEMQKKWEDDLKKAKMKGDPKIIMASISNPDTSPFNLASIVCLVKFKNKTILLTGDARGDDIISALDQHGLLKNGKCHVDILKVPHHGSDRNVSRVFFETISADHYIISGNGSHHNPDFSTLVMLEEGTRGRDKFTVYFTYRKGKLKLETKLGKWISDVKTAKRKFKIEFVETAKKSTVIDLLDPLNV